MTDHLSELLTRLDAEATPGPWEQEGLNYYNWITAESGEHELAQIEHKSDAELIVALRNAVPELLAALAECDQLRATVARIEALAEDYASADIDEDVYHTLASELRAALKGDTDE